jgi:hypothetical protein
VLVQKPAHDGVAALGRFREEIVGGVATLLGSAL